MPTREPEGAVGTPRRGSATASERLGRMLVIVPYLVQHQGTSLGEVATLFDVSAAQLRRDLDLLFMSGLPPYGPGDLIDVEVDEDDQIWIRMADHFSRPLRLSRQEALAVYVRGTELLASEGLPEAPALERALERLRESLGPETLGEAEGRIELAGRREAPPLLEKVRAAARDRSRVRVSYFAASTREWSTRTIEPEVVFSSLGNWYVAVWDVQADAERLLRVDRIRDAEPTGETFEARGLEGAGRTLYTPSAEDVVVRLRLAPGARWVAEYYATSSMHESADGSVEVELPARRLDWVAGLLLRLGPDAEVVDPPELAERTRELARAALARYDA